MNGHAAGPEKIDLLLLYEHVARELDVLCAVKHYCQARHGLRVEIVQQPYGAAEAIRRYNPRVVALPFCYANSLENYPFLLDWPNATYFNLAWEQLFYSGNVKAKVPIGEFETKSVVHHSWGAFFVDLLTAQGVPRKHIFENGQPAYGLYQEPYRAYFSSRSELARQYGLDPARPWIFFPENYNWAFYAKKKLEVLEQSGLDRAQIDEMVRFCHASLRAVLQWCAKVAAGAQVEIIVRPRPATPLKDFTAYAFQAIPEAAPSLHFIKGASVREWILASDGVVSSYSTSLIEAAVAGKASCMLEPYPIPASLQSEWHAHTARVTTPEAFEEFCRLNESGTDRRLGQWARATMLAHGDPIENLAQYLADVCLGRTKRPPRLRRGSIVARDQSRLPGWLRYEKQRRKGRAARLTPQSIVSTLYEGDLVGRAEIDRRVARWAEVLSATANHRAGTIWPDAAATTSPPL